MTTKSAILRHSGAIAFATSISLIALAALSTATRAQDAATDGASDLPPVDVPQKTPTTQSAPKAKPKKSEPAAAKSKPAAKPVAKAKPEPAPDPEPETIAAEPTAPADPATALGSYNPALDLRGLELPPGTEITTAGPVKGYQALSAVSSTKTATPLEQIPQSIQVVPKSVIEDQNSVTVSEALQNVSNVQGPNARSIADTQLYPVKIRGFGAEQWLDGLPVVYNAGDRDAFAHIERIEVLKGPSAILYGGGAGAPVGGAVNIVSKLPTDKASAEAGLRFGSNDYVLPYIDINQPISPNVLFRITAEYTSADSDIEVIEQDRYSINPAVTFTNRTDTSFTVQGRFSRSEQQTYQGLPVAGTLVGGFDVDRHLFIGPDNIERSYSEANGVTVTFDHKINEIFSTNVKARYTQTEMDQNTQILVSLDPTSGTPLTAPSTWLVANSELYQEQEEITVNPNLIAKFSAGETKNTVVLGGDYSRIKDRGLFTADYLGNACGAVLGTAQIDIFPPFGFFTPLCNFNPAGLVDLSNPNFQSPYSDPNPNAQYYDTTSFASLFPPPLGFGPIPQVATFTDAHSNYTTKGLYGQLQTSIFDRLHLLGGLRLANVEIDYRDAALIGQQHFVTDETKLLPRAGAVVDLFDGLSVYASYSEGLKGIPYSSRFPDPKPEESESREVGLKFNLGNQLSGTVAYFEIDRTNVPVTVALGLGGMTEQKSTGYEADIVWQPGFGWQILASYGYTDAEFADAFLASGITIDKGNKIPGVPEHSGRIWINYAFDQPILKGWSVGAGIYLASEQFVDNANLYQTEGYHTIDAKIAYEAGNFRAAFNVKNLTEEEYFVPYAFLGGQVAPGDDRAYYGTVAIKY